MFHHKQKFRRKLITAACATIFWSLAEGRSHCCRARTPGRRQNPSDDSELGRSQGVILPNQVLEMAIVGRQVWPVRVDKPIAYLDIDDTGLFEAGYGPVTP